MTIIILGFLVSIYHPALSSNPPPPSFRAFARSYYPKPEYAQAFFEDLFALGRPLGMSAYEIDFLNYPFSPGLVNTTSGLSGLMGGLGAAGDADNMPMQWCMPLPGQILFRFL